jgi:hypothetical protein
MFIVRGHAMIVTHHVLILGHILRQAESSAVKAGIPEAAKAEVMTS